MSQWRKLVQKNWDNALQFQLCSLTKTFEFELFNETTNNYLQEKT